MEQEIEGRAERTIPEEGEIWVVCGGDEVDLRMRGYLGKDGLGGEAAEDRAV